MSVRHYQLLVDCVVSDVATWYDKTTDGDAAVIALPVPPAVWLFHRPHTRAYWWTAGERGMTVSLGQARQRLAMVQERVLGKGALCRGAVQRGDEGATPH